MKHFCLEVRGDYACFTRPEMKVERVSYDVITPSAARAIFEAILWKPAIRWQVRRIEVLKPVRWISVRRNEVGSKVSTHKAIAAMNSGSGTLGLYVEDDRQQRAGLFLRDVAYRLYAGFQVVAAGEHDNAAKFTEIFERRAEKGQCVNQPYLGCREFAARFRLVADSTKETLPAPEVDGDLGWMLYDMDFTDPVDPYPLFFRARVDRGVMDLEGVEVRG